jgi:hypothetical protein
MFCESESSDDNVDGVIYKSTSMLSKIDLINKHLDKKIMQNNKKKKKMESPLALSSDIDEIPSFLKVNSTQQLKKGSLFDMPQMKGVIKQVAPMVKPPTQNFFEAIKSLANNWK